MTRLEDLYRRFPVLLLARRNIDRTPIRSALAALGIIIGVVAIASLGLFGTSLQFAATNNLGSIGNEVVVSPAFSEGVSELTERDVQRIRRAVPADAAVVPVKQQQAVVSYGRERTVVTVYGIENPEAVFTATDGRIPTPLRDGALVGSAVAERLDVGPGNTLTVGERSHRVKATLAQSSGFSTLSPNTAIVLPPDAVSGDGYDQVVIVAGSGRTANESAVAVRETLNDRRQRVSVFELQSITAQIGSFFGILNAFLIGIGSISLLVAGVSILNVMLMSTVERREEIGVLRAVGYQQRDVLRMMLVEAALLGVLGGVVGVLLSVVAGLAINQVLLQQPLLVFRPVNLGYLALAFVFGLGTSVVSGLYPAWKAANRHPVEALRG